MQALYKLDHNVGGILNRTGSIVVVMVHSLPVVEFHLPCI